MDRLGRGGFGFTTKSPCWIVRVGSKVYVSNAGSGTVAGFQLGAGDTLSPIGLTPTNGGTVDAAQAQGRFLYVQTGAEGVVDEFIPRILLAAVVLFRIVWRLMPNHRIPPITVGWMEIASRAVHYLLYALLAAEAVLGFILRWAGAESMSFFGILIPPPFAPWSRGAHHQVGEFHEKIGWAIVIVALGHAAAALWHHFAKHDRVLVRMAPWVRQR